MRGSDETGDRENMSYGSIDSLSSFKLSSDDGDRKRAVHIDS